MRRPPPPSSPSPPPAERPHQQQAQQARGQQQSQQRQMHHLTLHTPYAASPPPSSSSSGGGGGGGPITYPASAAPAMMHSGRPAALSPISPAAGLGLGLASSTAAGGAHHFDSLLSPSFSPFHFQSSPEPELEESPQHHSMQQHHQHQQQMQMQPAPPQPLQLLHPPILPQQQSAQHQFSAPPSPARAQVHVADADADDDDDDDDEAYLARRMAQTAAAAAAARSSVVPPFRPASVFSRPPPSAQPQAAQASDTAIEVPAATASSSSAATAAVPAPSSSSGGLSAQFALATPSPPLSMPSQVYSQPQPQSQPQSERTRRSSVSSVSSGDGMESPPRARQSQPSSSMQRGSSRHSPPLNSPARTTLFPETHHQQQQQQQSRYSQQQHSPPPSSSPLSPHQSYRSPSAVNLVAADASLEDLFRELAASAPPSDLRLRISALRERLQQSEGARSAFEGRVADLETEITNLRDVNTRQYLQLQEQAQHIEFLSQARTQPSNASSPALHDLSALRGRALEQAHLQISALQQRLSAQENEISSLRKQVTYGENERVSMVHSYRDELDRLRKEYARMETHSRSTIKHVQTTLSSTGQSVEQLQAHNEELQRQVAAAREELQRVNEQFTHTDLQLAQTLEALHHSEKNNQLLHERLEEEGAAYAHLEREHTACRAELDSLTTAQEIDGTDGGSVTRLRAQYEAEMARLREQYEVQVRDLNAKLSLCEERLNYMHAKYGAGGGDGSRLTTPTGSPARPGRGAAAATSTAAAAAVPASPTPLSSSLIHNDTDPDLGATPPPARSSSSSGGASRIPRRAASPSPINTTQPREGPSYAALHALQAELSAALQRATQLDAHNAELREANLQLQHQKEEMLRGATQQIEQLQQQARLSRGGFGLGGGALRTPGASPHGSPSRRFGSAASNALAAAGDLEFVESLQEQITQLKEANAALMARLRAAGASSASEDEEASEEEEDSAPQRRRAHDIPARPISMRKDGSAVYPPGPRGKDRIAQQERAAAAEELARKQAEKHSAAFAPEFLADLSKFLPHFLAQAHTLQNASIQLDRWVRFFGRHDTTTNNALAASGMNGANSSVNDSTASSSFAAAAVSSSPTRSPSPLALTALEAEILASSSEADETSFARFLAEQSEQSQSQAERDINAVASRAQEELKRGSPHVDGLQKFALESLLRLSAVLSALPPRLSAHRARVQLEEENLATLGRTLLERERALEQERASLVKRVKEFEQERGQVQDALLDEESLLRQEAQALSASASSGAAGPSSGASASDLSAKSSALSRQTFASKLPVYRKSSPFFLKEALNSLTDGGSCSNETHSKLMQQCIELHEELSAVRKGKENDADLRAQLAESEELIQTLKESLRMASSSAESAHKAQQTASSHDAQLQIQNLTSSAALLQSRLDSLVQSKVSAEEEIASLRTSNEHLSSLFHELDEDYTELEKEMREWRSRVEGRVFLEEDVVSHRRRNKDGTRNARFIGNYVAPSGTAPGAGDKGDTHFTSHLAAISRSGQLLSSISADNSALTSKAIEQARQLHALENDLAQLRAAKREGERQAKEEWASLLAKSEQAQQESANRIASLEEEHAETVAGFESKVALLTRSNSELEQAARDAAKRYAALERSLAQVQLDRDARVAEVTELRRRMERSAWSFRLAQELHDYLRAKRNSAEKAEVDALIQSLRDEIARLQDEARQTEIAHEKSLAETRLLVSHPVASSLRVYLNTFPLDTVSKLGESDSLAIRVVDLLREKLLARIERAAGVHVRGDTMTDASKAALSGGFTETDASKRFLNAQALYKADWSALENAMLLSWDNLLFQQFQGSMFAQEKVWINLFQACKRHVGNIMRGAGAVPAEPGSEGNEEHDAKKGAAGKSVKFSPFARGPAATTTKVSAQPAGSPTAAAGEGSVPIGARKQQLSADEMAEVDLTGLQELLALREQAVSHAEVQRELEQLRAEATHLREQVALNTEEQLEASAAAASAGSHAATEAAQQDEAQRDQAQQIESLQAHVDALEQALAERQPAVQTSRRELELLRTTRAQLQGSAGSRVAQVQGAQALAAQSAQLQAANATLAQENAAWARKYADVQSRCAQLQQELDALQTAASAVVAPLPAAPSGGTLLATLQGENAQLQSDLFAQRARSQALQAEVLDLHEQLEEAAHARAPQKGGASVHSSSSKERSVRGGGENSGAGGASSAVLQRTIATLKARLASEHSAADDAAEQLSRAQQEVEPLRAQVQHLREELRGAQETIDALSGSGSASASRSGAAAPSSSSAPSSSFAKAAVSAQREQERLQRALAEAQSSARTATERCAKLDAEISSLRNAQRNWQRERDELEAEHEEEIIQLQQQQAGGDHSSPSHPRRKSARRDMNSSTQDAPDESSSAIAASQAAQEEPRAEVAALQRENAEWETKFVQVRRQTQELQKKLVAATAAATQAQSAATQQQSQSDDATTRELRAQLEESQCECEELQREVERLTQRVVELEAMLAAAQRQQRPSQAQQQSQQQHQHQPQQHAHAQQQHSFAQSEALSSEDLSSSMDPVSGARFASSAAVTAHQPTPSPFTGMLGAPPHQGSSSAANYSVGGQSSMSQGGPRVHHHHHVFAAPAGAASMSAAGTLMRAPAAAGAQSSASNGGDLSAWLGPLPVHVSHSQQQHQAPGQQQQQQRPHSQQPESESSVPGAAKIAEAFDEMYRKLERAQFGSSRIAAGDVESMRGASDAPETETMAQVFERKKAEMRAKATRASSVRRYRDVSPSAGSGRARYTAPAAAEEEKESAVSLWPAHLRKPPSSGLSGADGGPSAAGGLSFAALARASVTAAVTSSEGESLPFPYFPRGPLMALSAPLHTDPQRFSAAHAAELAVGVRGEPPGVAARTALQRVQERRAEELALGVRPEPSSRAPREPKPKPYSFVPKSIIRAATGTSAAGSSRGTPTKRAASAHARSRVR